VVLDLDQDATALAVSVQCHLGVTLGELKRVLQQIADRRGEHFRVGIHRDIEINRRHGELNPGCSRIKSGSGLYFT
jgi:hypothetical protein